jgi:hypothetical protein
MYNLNRYVWIMAKAGKNKVRRVKSPAVYRLKDRERPISGDSIGSYLQVATYNMAGNAFGKPCMSFEKPFKLEADRLVVTDRDLKRALHALNSKYTLTQKE